MLLVSNLTSKSSSFYGFFRCWQNTSYSFTHKKTLLVRKAIKKGQLTVYGSTFSFPTFLWPFDWTLMTEFDLTCFFDGFSASNTDSHWFATSQLKHEVETCTLKGTSTPPLYHKYQKSFSWNCIDWTSWIPGQLYTDSVMDLVKASHCWFLKPVRHKYFVSARFYSIYVSEQKWKQANESRMREKKKGAWG